MRDRKKRINEHIKHEITIHPKIIENSMQNQAGKNDAKIVENSFQNGSQGEVTIIQIHSPINEDSMQNLGSKKKMMETDAQMDPKGRSTITKTHPQIDKKTMHNCYMFVLVCLWL